VKTAGFEIIGFQLPKLMFACLLVRVVWFYENADGNTRK
jgi:hypothetical protein